MANNPNTEVNFVSIDDGHADCKVTWFEGGEIRSLSYPSRTRSGEGMSDAEGARTNTYFTGGQPFQLVADGEYEDTRFNDFPTSLLNRVLVYHGLMEAGFGGKEVHLATSLPLGRYFKDSRRNDDLVAHKIDNLKQPVKRASGDARPVIFASQRIYPESVAAAYDYMIDAACNVTNKFRTLGVVDIGGRTTDVVTLKHEEGRGTQIDHTHSKTFNIGVLNVYDKLKVHIRVEQDTNDEDFPGLAESLHTGSIRLWGKDHDLRGPIDSAVRAVGDEILRNIQKVITSAAGYDKILFVGGGAAVFESLVANFPRNGSIPHDPTFANSRGMLKAMKSTIAEQMKRSSKAA